MMTLLFVTLGCVFGSFVYATVLRVASGEGITLRSAHRGSRSHCDACGHVLSGWDMVPVLSYVVYGARCRYCRASIHPNHLYAELLYGIYGYLVSISAYSVFQQWILFVCGGVFVFVFFYDALYYEIVDSLMVASAVIFFGLNLVFFNLSWQSMLWGAVAAGGFFFAQYSISRGRWIGDGDIFLGVTLGVFLGLPRTLVALMLAYCVGALYALWLIVTRKAELRAQIPFGTFLSIATLVSVVYGLEIVEWYLRLIHYTV